MDAYFNELTAKTYTSELEAKEAFLKLGNSLKKLQDFGISNVKTARQLFQYKILPNRTFYQVLGSTEIIDSDLKSVLMGRLCSLEPIDDLENKYNIVGLSYNNIPCKGLGWACGYLENSVALGFYEQKIWDEAKYDVLVEQLNEDGETLNIVSTCRHISVDTVIDVYRDFLQGIRDIPANGKVLANRTSQWFPHLFFAKQAEEQIKAIKDQTIIKQIYFRLKELERVASNCSENPIKPTDFVTKTTPESSTREKLPELRILFPNKEIRICSWHARYTPGAGRIHFYPDEINKKFYVGYIGEKIPV